MPARERCAFVGRLALAIPVLFTLACGGARNESGRGVVAAASPEAAAAGAEILASGGNAIDAAVAVAFTLAVTEPAMSGLGGQTQILVARPGDRPFVINGTSFSPANTPTDVTAADVSGHRATTVPTTVRVLEYALRHHGSGRFRWGQLIEPAHFYATQGFHVGEFRHKVWARHADDLQQHPAVRALFLMPDGSVPQPGDRFLQPVLAETLRRLAVHGAADFYTGDIARELVRDMEINGGWITLDDLERLPEPTELSPLRGSYRGFDVYTLPPPGGGWVVLQILNLLELTAPASLALDAPTRVAHLARALRIAHRMRRDDPVTDLARYGPEVAERIDKDAARQMWDRGETTHFTVADAEGAVVSVTASINAYFGARVASPRLGFLYNDYMHEFELGDPEHPFALRPQAMPYSSMSPTIVARDGRPVLGLGSPGSARIISAVAQVIQRWVDGGQDIASAVAEPRVHVVPDSALFLEARPTAPDVLRELTNLGFRLEEARHDLALGDRNAYFGGVHAVAFEDGRWVGAADPRRDGRAIGVALERAR